jgi:hypothetical protein
MRFGFCSMGLSHRGCFLSGGQSTRFSALIALKYEDKGRISVNIGVKVVKKPNWFS